MSLWWMFGGGTTAATPPVPSTTDNAPSLWSGGVHWGDDAAAFGDGTDAYWGASTVPPRSGAPRLSVAIAGELVMDLLRSASWSLGRQDWLSTLNATSGTFDFVDEPIAAPNDSIVVGLMSDTEEYHSDALWVGRVDDVTVTRDLDGNVSTTVSATDVIGVLGQAKSPVTIAAGYTLQTLVERLAEDAGVALDIDVIGTLPTLNAATDLSGSVLDLVNRAERSSNALLFLTGSGRLRAAVRAATGASSVRVFTLDGPESPAGWTEQTSLRNVITRWQLGDGSTWTTETLATTYGDGDDHYGDRPFTATDLLITDPAPYANLISADVLANPRPIVTDAPFHVRDLEQQVLTIDPLDRVVNDGTTWQVMSVSHAVKPIRVEDGQTIAEWTVNITADATQEALEGAPEPGPVEPPALRTTVVTYVSSKAATAELQSDGDKTGTSLGDLLAGKFSNGSRYRATVEWDITPPVNAIRVVSAKVRFKNASANQEGRIVVRRITESWSEGTMDWPGPSTTSVGERRSDVPKAAGKSVELSITQIATDWHRKGNYGLRISSVNEDSPLRAVTFYSDDSSNSEDRPRLTITWEVVS